MQTWTSAPSEQCYEAPHNCYSCSKWNFPLVELWHITCPLHVIIVMKVGFEYSWLYAQIIDNSNHQYLSRTLDCKTTQMWWLANIECKELKWWLLCCCVCVVVLLCCCFWCCHLMLFVPITAYPLLFLDKWLVQIHLNVNHEI
jgi:hypothetical protein